MKRAVDIFGALVLGLLTFPFTVVMSGASAVMFRAWPLFRQDRVGLGGAPFSFIKIRTLPEDAPAYASKYHLKTPSGLPAFLRTTHLDELPQLWLVLIGTMSLVGPRPEMQVLHDQMTPQFGSTRVSVRPGCTGLWQISAHQNRLIAESPEYDEFYVAHRTMRLDLWIAWRTVLNMAARRTINLTDVPTWTLTSSGRRAIENRPKSVSTVEAL